MKQLYLTSLALLRETNRVSAALSQKGDYTASPFDYRPSKF